MCRRPSGCGQVGGLHDPPRCVACGKLKLLELIAPRTFLNRLRLETLGITLNMSLQLAPSSIDTVNAAVSGLGNFREDFVVDVAALGIVANLSFLAALNQQRVSALQVTRAATEPSTRACCLLPSIALFL